MPITKKKNDDASAPKGQAKWLMYAVYENAHLIQRLTERKTANLGWIRGCSFMLADLSAPEKSLLGVDHYIFDLETATSSALNSEHAQASLIKTGQTWIDCAVHAKFYEEHEAMSKRTRNELIKGLKNA